MSDRTPKVISNIAASVHQRLLNLAQARRRPFNEIAQYYAMERFLARLGHTPYVDQFVLKGALALRAWHPDEARATRDLDFLLRPAGRLDIDQLTSDTTNTTSRITNILMYCLEVPLALNDGVLFDATSIRVERIVGQTDEAGIRATFRGRLGTTRLTMQVDLGFGDAVEPPPVWLEYPQLLDPTPLRVLGYTIETIVAEKFHAIVVRDIANSRMKDFYDLWTICHMHPPDGGRLTTAIAATFEKRNTPLPTDVPTGLSEAFTNDTGKTAQWRAYWQKIHPATVPPSLGEVATQLARWLLPTISRTGETTGMTSGITSERDTENN